MLEATQRISPSSSISACVMSSECTPVSASDRNSILELGSSSSPSLYHVTFGTGRPVTRTSNRVASPSMTSRSISSCWNSGPEMLSRDRLLSMRAFILSAMSSSCDSDSDMVSKSPENERGTHGKVVCESGLVSRIGSVSSAFRTKARKQRNPRSTPYYSNNIG